MNSRDAGLSASTPSLKCRKKNFISGLARLSTETMAPFCTNSCADADSISSCSPTLRKISMVRWWNEAARGWTAVPRCRSTSRCGTSCAASSNDVDSPTRLPPTISTGTWRSLIETSLAHPTVTDIRPAWRPADADGATLVGGRGCVKGHKSTRTRPRAVEAMVRATPSPGPSLICRCTRSSAG